MAIRAVPVRGGSTQAFSFRIHDHSSGPEITGGRVGFNGQANGYANGSFNGSDNGISNGHHAGSNGTLNGNAHYTRSHSSENRILNGNTAETSQSLNGYRSGSANLNANSNVTSDHVVEPVAIVGMAMRLPGGAHNGDDFWDFLINKRNGQCHVPKDRYNIDAWYGPGKSGHVGTQHGYFLEDPDLSHIDASFWSMTKQEAELMDPQQRLILEVVYEALEMAGEKNWWGRNIGCYVGIFGEDWLDMDSKDVQNMHLYHCQFLTG